MMNQKLVSLGSNLETLQLQGSELARQWDELEESKTEILRKLAIVVVEVRKHFHDPETGQPDWRGKTFDYRQFMSVLYARSAIPPASVSGVQSSLRYHVGNRLREVVAPEELLAAGLLADGPKERMGKNEQERTEKLVQLERDVARYQKVLQSIVDHDSSTASVEALQTLARGALASR